MSKLRVGIIYGGPSKEHDVSVSSGLSMLEHLNKKKYDASGIFIDHSQKWHFNDKLLTQTEALKEIKDLFDFVLLGLHGTFGEDGQVQTLLDKQGINYSGSGAEASKLAMEKHKSFMAYKKVGLTLPKEKVLTAKALDATKGYDFPLVIKPEAQGSSFGVSIVQNQSEVMAALDAAFSEDDTVLVQEYIKGRELSCGVIEDSHGELVALPPTELAPVSAQFFDYEAKYTPGATKEITPPDLQGHTIAEIQEIALQAHKVLGCAGYSRTDMILRGKDLFVLETNTLPGMTATSILPQQAAAANITYPALLDLMIEAGLRNKRV